MTEDLFCLGQLPPSQMTPLCVRDVDSVIYTLKLKLFDKFWHGTCNECIGPQTEGKEHNVIGGGALLINHNHINVLKR